MSVIKPPTVKNFIKSMYVCSTHGPSYMLDMRFLTPGRYFFNEELADKDVVIPETVVRLSTRKRHALRGSEKGEGVSVSGKEEEKSEKKAIEKKKGGEKSETKKGETKKSETKNQMQSGALTKRIVDVWPWMLVALAVAGTLETVIFIIIVRRRRRESHE